jgi:hypothetical protein
MNSRLRCTGAIVRRRPPLHLEPCRRVPGLCCSAPLSACPPRGTLDRRPGGDGHRPSAPSTTLPCPSLPAPEVSRLRRPTGGHEPRRSHERRRGSPAVTTNCSRTCIGTVPLAPIGRASHGENLGSSDGAGSVWGESTAQRGTILKGAERVIQAGQRRLQPRRRRSAPPGRQLQEDLFPRAPRGAQPVPQGSLVKQHRFMPPEQHDSTPDTPSERASNERHFSVKISPVTPTPHITRTHKTAGQDSFATGSRIATHST